ncbi:MAG: type II toxin-antitoxin system RelE/ParE family toxin [Smithellaceae bacterium]|nr:type II toxin-antitoxin system RelE/ParE family toxin [Smithellaceae bacterium]
MNFDFHPEAETEFLESIAYYEGCESGLGEDFSLEVYSTLQNILLYPLAWPVLEDEIRRCLTNRFPYGVLYSVESDRVYILAVMHLHRHPEYWKHRK